MSKIKSVIEGFDCRLQVAKITSGKTKCYNITNKINGYIFNCKRWNTARNLKKTAPF
jgi:hypothetical protein